jgi:hypothetical protein
MIFKILEVVHIWPVSVTDSGKNQEHNTRICLLRISLKQCQKSSSNLTSMAHVISGAYPNVPPPIHRAKPSLPRKCKFFY